MLPHRDWSRFELVTLLRQSDDNSDQTVDKWTTDHLLFADGHAGKMGSFTPETDIYQAFHPIFKPKDSSFELVTSMDQVVDFGFWYMVSLLDNSAGETSGGLRPFVLDDVSQADYGLVNGKYYDGVVGNVWDKYPPGRGHNYFEDQILTIANLPLSDVSWIKAYDMSPYGNDEQVMFFKNGARLQMVNWVGGDSEPFPVNNSCLFWVDIQKIRVNYLNAVVNSMSRRRMLPAGGVSLVLTGLGFNQSDAELGSTARNSTNDPTHNWLSLVDFIDFIGLQGQGTTTLTGGGVDFTVDSDTQITIASMPALALGTYDIRLRKEGVDIAAPNQVYSYAGDFRTDSSGLATPGNRIRFFSSVKTDTPGPQIILTKWKFKRGDDETERWYSPIDIPATDVFWDGRILKSSPITRAVNDKTGLFETSSMTLDMVNSDKEFSKLLAQYLLKNQIVEVSSAMIGQPASEATPVIQMIVDDYILKGPVFWVSLKDIIHKYFQTMLPKYRCTEEDYPDIHPDHKDREMPEILGNASLTTGDAPGAVEAIYVDTTEYKYLAARGSLHAVNEVYSDGKLKVLNTHYTISYEDGGRTIITFTSNQKRRKITFNSEGYMFEDWNSDDGYVQNPAYILAFFLAFLAEMPMEKLDITSFETLATLFETTGDDASGKLILQQERNSKTTLQELLFSYGTKGFPANDGRMTVERKDISNYATALTYFEQLDVIGVPQRKMNLNQTINRLKTKFDFIPTTNFFKGGDEDDKQVSIDDFEAVMEPSSPYLFPWTDSETWVAQRLSEELSKFAYGNKKLMVSIPLQNIEDIDVFSNFKFQDPYGLSTTGAGEAARYYYIQSLTYDFEGQKIDIVAIDFQWLLGQYFVFGDRDALAALWANAGEQDKMFGYFCNRLTGLFANYEPGKLWISRDIIS